MRSHERLITHRAFECHFRFQVNISDNILVPLQNSLHVSKGCSKKSEECRKEGAKR